MEIPQEAALVEAGADRLFVSLDGRKQSALVRRVGDKTWISFGGQQYVVEKPKAGGSGGSSGSGSILAPMPGLLIDVKVAVGDKVQVGQVLVVLEAMKTQQPLTSQIAGTITKLGASAGEQVAAGQLLVEVTSDPED